MMFDEVAVGYAAISRMARVVAERVLGMYDV
jgi:hypothetical protein